MNRLRLSSGLIVLALAASACTGSVEFSFGGQGPVDAAVELIEGSEMAQRLGVSTISDAVCDEPENEDVGTVFACTAQSDGLTIDFEVDFEEDDRIFASPTNVIDPAGIARLEIAGVDALNDVTGFELTEDLLECGGPGGGAILDADMQVICKLTDPGDGALFDVQVTMNDMVTGNFDIVIVGESAS